MADALNISFMQKGSEDKKPMYHKTSQNGAPPLARLQQKVARLEISLRDKDSELAKLNESTKSTLVNELRVQTEMYYQEVLRLRNQLNLLQETQMQQKLSSIHEASSFKNDFNKQSNEKKNSFDRNEEKLKESIEKLKEENKKLSQKLSSIHADKEKLAKDYQEVLKKTEKKVIKSTAIVMEEETQTSPTQKIPEMFSIPSQSLNTSEESISILKGQIEELQRKEKAWEEERASFKELIVNLQEDRCFYKDVSQQKHEELGSLQNEMTKLHKDVLILQKDIGAFNDIGKPLCNNCTQNSNAASNQSIKPAKSKSRSLIRTSKSLPKSQKSKSSSNPVRSPSEASSPSSLHGRTGKSSEKSSKIIRSKAVVSSESSTSCSNSSPASPVHNDSLKKEFSSSPIVLDKSSDEAAENGSHSSSAQQIFQVSSLKSDASISDVHTRPKILTKPSQFSSRPASEQSHVATQSHSSLSNSPASLKSTFSSSKVNATSLSSHSLAKSNSIRSPSVSSQSSLIKSNHSSLNKLSAKSPQSDCKASQSPKLSSNSKCDSLQSSSKLHRSLSLSPRKSPSKLQKSVTKSYSSPKHLKSPSNSSAKPILSTSSTLEKVTSIDKDNEDSLHSSDLPSNFNSKDDIEIANEILKDLAANGLGDSVNKQHMMNTAPKVPVEESLTASPKHRPRSISKPISRTSSSSAKGNDNLKSDSNSQVLHIEEASTKKEQEECLIAVLEAHIMRSSKLKELHPRSKSAVTSQKKRLTRKKENASVGESSSISTDQSQETEKEIEEMISLLEAHVNRKAFLALVNIEKKDDAS